MDTLILLYLLLAALFAVTIWLCLKDRLARRRFWRLHGPRVRDALDELVRKLRNSTSPLETMVVDNYLVEMSDARIRMATVMPTPAEYYGLRMNLGSRKCSLSLNLPGYQMNCPLGCETNAWWLSRRLDEVFRLIGEPGRERPFKGGR